MAAPAGAPGCAAAVDLGFARDYAAHWVTGRELGRGGFGVTHEATRAPGDGGGEDAPRRAAVKLVAKARLASPADVAALQREAAVMARLAPHPHVVVLLGAYETATHVQLVQTLCAGGELYTRLAAAGAYAEADAARAVRALMSALAHAHAKGVVCLDVKLENLLLDTETGTLRAADFGLAQFLPPGGHGSGAPVGTAYYCAPELLLRHAYGAESDCWSAGVLTYILLTGRPPFNGASERDILRRIALDAAPAEFASPPWPSLSPAARCFTQALLARDPPARLTAADALAHPWLAGVDAAAERIRGAPLDAAVLSRLRAFHAAGAARRAALRALAATFAARQLPHAAAQFAALDADGDGAVSRDQLRAALRGAGTADAEADALCRDLDATGAGTLHWTDYAAAAMRAATLRGDDAAEYQRHVSEAFTSLDADADGFLTGHDLANACSGGGCAEDADADAALLAEADADGDGRVGRADFEALLLRRSGSAPQVSEASR